MSSSYRIELDKWLSQLDVSADRVLDIGGVQEQMPSRVKSWEVSEYIISDLEFAHKGEYRNDIILDMNKRWDTNKLSYIAGIVDGEGSITVAKTVKSSGNDFYSPQFGMNMMNKKPFEIIEEVFKFGKTRYFTQKPSGKKFYGLQLTGKDLELFLTILLPYLVVKQKQAAIALNLRDDINKNRKSFKVNPLGGFNGSQSQPKNVVEYRSKLYETTKLLNHYSEYFDTIFCLEVADYWFDPVTAMETIDYFLKSGGTAWVTFPSQYPLHQPVKDDALRYMPGGIKKLAKSAGLEIVQMIPRRTETDAIYRAFRTERMRCAKHEDHNISGWIVELRK